MYWVCQVLQADAGLSFTQLPQVRHHRLHCERNMIGTRYGIGRRIAAELGIAGGQHFTFSYRHVCACIRAVRHWLKYAQSRNSATSTLVQ